MSKFCMQLHRKHLNPGRSIPFSPCKSGPIFLIYAHARPLNSMQSKFCKSVPMRLDKKDANRKTRDLLGFSSFFPVFLTFLKIGFEANKKMPIGVLVLRTRNEPLWHLPWSRCHSYIRLRRGLLLRSGIRLSPSDIRYASLRGEYNITATTELQSNSEQYHCCLQQYHADTVSISLPI